MSLCAFQDIPDESRCQQWKLLKRIVSEIALKEAATVAGKCSATERAVLSDRHRANARPRLPRMPRTIWSWQERYDVCCALRHAASLTRSVLARDAMSSMMR